MAIASSAHVRSQVDKKIQGAEGPGWASLLVHWSDTGSLPDSKAQTLYEYLYALSPLKSIDLARDGVPASAVEGVAQALDMPLAKVQKALNVPASTLARKIKSRENLPVDQSERVIQAMRLIGLAEQLVDEYGDPELSQGFDAAKWFGGWIEEPNPALDMRRPVEFLDTATGAGLVESLLHKMVSGVYA